MINNHHQPNINTKRLINLKHSHQLQSTFFLILLSLVLLLTNCHNRFNQNIQTLYEKFNFNNNDYANNNLKTSSPLVIFAEAFNVDVASCIVQRGPTGSYFGYSVALHKDRGTCWLIIGAPKAQTDQPGLEKPGAVYRCTVDNTKACQQIPFDPTGSSTMQLGNETKHTDDKSHQWFGATVQSSGDTGFIVVSV